MVGRWGGAIAQTETKTNEHKSNMTITTERPVYQQWHYVREGKKIPISECRKMKYVDRKLWGDVFHYIYEDEEGRLFCYSEWYSCTMASEGCWVSYCYL